MGWQIGADDSAMRALPAYEHFVPVGHGRSSSTVSVHARRAQIDSGGEGAGGGAGGAGGGGGGEGGGGGGGGGGAGGRETKWNSTPGDLREQACALKSTLYSG
jgi:hypothetical protein